MLSSTHLGGVSSGRIDGQTMYPVGQSGTAVILHAPVAETWSVPDCSLGSAFCPYERVVSCPRRDAKSGNSAILQPWIRRPSRYMNRGPQIGQCHDSISSISLVERMNGKSFICALAVSSLTLSATIVYAGGREGGLMVVYDRGQDSCGQFIQARRFDLRENSAYSIWLAGYITAYNQFMSDTTDLLNLPANVSEPMAGPMAWLEKYCTANPMSDVITAAIKFTEAQYPNRRR